MIYSRRTHLRRHVTKCEVGRIATSFLAIFVACSSERNASQDRESTAAELGIADELGKRIGVAVRVRCVWLPPSCRARLPDTTTLPIVIRAGGTWHVDGALVLADDIEQYLRDELVDLGAPQVARCGARIRAVSSGDRIECALQNGGRAFVVVRGDGSTAVEIVLDAAVGAARSEISHDIELSKMSNALDTDQDNDD